MSNSEKIHTAGNGELLQLLDEKLMINAFGWDTVTTVDIGEKPIPIALKGSRVRSIVLGDHIRTNRQFILSSSPDEPEYDLDGTVVGIVPNSASDLFIKVLYTMKDVNGNFQDLLKPSEISFLNLLERNRETPVSAYKMPYQYMGRMVNLIFIDDEGGTNRGTRYFKQRRIGMVETFNPDGSMGRLIKIGDITTPIDGVNKDYSLIYDIRLEPYDTDEDSILLLNNGAGADSEKKTLKLEEFLAW